jgi:hypothetical protein
VSDQIDVLQGTPDLLIMRTIALAPMRGWAVAQRVQQGSLSFYSLTKAGRRQLAVEVSKRERLAAGGNFVPHRT